MLFKHKDNEDVAFEVLKKFYIKEKKQWQLKIRWWNIGRVHPPWCMGISQKINIDKATWSNDWRHYAWRPIDRTAVKQVIQEQTNAKIRLGV